MEGGRAADFRGGSEAHPHCSSTQHLLLKPGRFQRPLQDSRWSLL